MGANKKVHHLDHEPLNNDADNLMWLARQEHKLDNQLPQFRKRQNSDDIYVDTDYNIEKEDYDLKMGEEDSLVTLNFVEEEINIDLKQEDEEMSIYMEQYDDEMPIHLKQGDEELKLEDLTDSNALTKEVIKKVRMSFKKDYSLYEVSTRGVAHKDGDSDNAS